MAERNESGFFDKFADAVARRVASAPFFAGCVLLVLVWAPSFFVIRNVDTWQLIINTVTTIITFILLALLHNTTERFEKDALERLDRIEEKLK
jgi:low affinity Fe/Cu permease